MPIIQLSAIQRLINRLVSSHAKLICRLCGGKRCFNSFVSFEIDKLVAENDRLREELLGNKL